MGTQVGLSRFVYGTVSGRDRWCHSVRLGSAVFPPFNAEFDVSRAC